MSNRLKISAIIFLNIFISFALFDFPNRLFSQNLGPIAIALLFLSGVIQGGLLKVEWWWAAALIGTFLGMFCTLVLLAPPDPLIGLGVIFAYIGTLLIQFPELLLFPAIRSWTQKK